MPAPQEINITRLGIIAGGGSLPQQLVVSCKAQGIDVFLVCFDGYTSTDLPKENPHIWTRLGAVGKIINYFKGHNVHDVVMIGHIKRPSLTDVSPDLKGLQILSRIGFKALGDNSLLSLLKNELETEGLRVRAVQDFCDNLLVGEGPIGSLGYESDEQETIDLGLRASQALGALDIGQSVVVQNGVVVAVEAKEGTDALIKRCSELLDGRRGGILVKTCKPQQDKSLDLPTIGLDTIRNAHNVGLCGIILHAHNVIIPDIKTVAEYADRYKIFVVGVKLPVEEGEV